MNKRKAIEVVNAHLGEDVLNNGNTCYSTMTSNNAGEDVWWFTVPPQKFKSELHALLAKEDGDSLIWLRIKASQVSPELFKQRSDGKVDWEICANTPFLRDIRSGETGYDFRPHIAHQWQDATRKGAPRSRGGRAAG